MKKENILIIKLGALGDIILATGPMKAIRERHADAHIVLMTSKPFVALLQACPFIDELWIDEKRPPHDFRGVKKLVTMLHRYRWEWVYDLQTSTRSTTYFYFLPLKKPNVSGLARFASHRHDTQERKSLHTIDRQKQQLAIAGIAEVPPPDIHWLKGDVARFHLPERYALLVPGGSAHRPEKRWPGERFAELAAALKSKGITPVLIGAGAEEGLLSEISAGGIVNLCNQTSYGDIAELARHATFAVGNDTGPMHIIAATGGCPSLVLFSAASNPALCAPRGENARFIQVENLVDLQVDMVFELLPL